MNNVDPALTAVCNLLAAVSTDLLSNGRKRDLQRLLLMFEKMNETNIGSEDALRQLKLTVNVQRRLLEQMPD